MKFLASLPNEMLTLRFENFEDKVRQKSVLYYANKKNQRKKFTISEELYTQVMNFKEMNVNNGTYQIRSFTAPTGKTITGHFVFDLTRSKLQKKFSKICKVNSRYEIKTKRHQNVIYFKWVSGAWNLKVIFSWTAHISKDNSKALHKNWKGF